MSFELKDQAFIVFKFLASLIVLLFKLIFRSCQLEQFFLKLGDFDMSLILF